MKKRVIIPISLGILMLTSCVSREKIVNYQDIDINNITLKNFETVIKPDDLLMILVSAQDPVAVQPYNLTTNMSVDPTNQAGSGQRQQQLYLVNQQGFIEFPGLGSISVGNKSKDQIVQELQTKISKFVKDPIVNLRIMNYKISVQGEVRKPGTHTITSERITLPEALSLSGDLTVYGRRENILVLREDNGELKHHRVDLTKSDFINSDFYYLKQNDIIYVEPNKVAINSSAVGPNVSIYMTAASLLLSTVAIILSNTKK